MTETHPEAGKIEENGLTQPEIDGIMFDFVANTLIGGDEQKAYRVLNELYEDSRTTRWFLVAPEPHDLSRGVQDFMIAWVSFDKKDMAMWGDLFVWDDVVNVRVELTGKEESGEGSSTDQDAE